MKKWKKAQAIVLATAVMVGLSPLSRGLGQGNLFEQMKVYATSAQEKKREAENSLSKAQDKINEVQKLQDEVKSQMSEKALEVTELMTQIELMETDIQDTNERIRQAEESLKKAQKEEEDQYQAMQLRIQYMYENGSSNSILSAIIEAKGLTDLLNRIEYVNRIYSSDRDLLNEYEAIVQEVKDIKSDLELKKSDLVSMKQSADEQKLALDAAMEELKAQSEDYDNQIATAQSLAKEYARVIAEQNEIIRREEEERRAREEAERKAREEAERKAREEAERKAREEAERKAREEAERKAREEAAQKAREEAAQKAREEAERKAREEAERKAREEAEKQNEGTTEANSQGSEQNNPDPDSGHQHSDSSPSVTAPTGSDIVDYALQYVGCHYVWAGNTMGCRNWNDNLGVDCSGFVHQVMLHFGIDSPRYSQSFRYWGTPVSEADMRPGDVVVYPGHVAIYMGNGKIVEAQSSNAGVTCNRSVYNKTIYAIRRAPGR